MADAMANINALIAQGPKPIQLNDPLGQMAKMYQIKSAQQELTANEQKLAEANALREFLKSNPDLTSSATLNKLTTGFGPTGLAYGTKLLEIEKARRAERTAEQKLVDDKTKYFRDALSGVNTPDDARMWTAAIYSDPNLGPVFKGMGVTAEQAIAKIPTDPAQFENWKRNAALGATKFAELNKPQFFQQDLGGSRRIIAMPGMGGAAEVVPGSAADKTAPPRYAINPVTGVSELLSPDTVRPAGGQPGAAPAGQPGAAPLAPGIAPAGQPVVTPTARSSLDMMQAPAFQELVRRGVVSTPQEAAALAQAMSLDAAGKPVNITVPNALAGAAPSVNAMAGAPTGPAPSGLTPVQANIAFRAQQEAAYRQPPAPTLTQIVDPTDSNKMLTIDARRYEGGGAGSPGVIGVSGKEPSAAARENKAEAGKTQLQDEIDNLRASFNRLNTFRAIPSTERGGLSNVASSAQGSAAGQMLGRAFGTEAQVERDVITSAKQRLITAIKNATGMSSQQLNSNFELQTMLRSLSDVNVGYEASTRILDNIENAYVKGAKMKGADAAKGTGGARGAATSSVRDQADAILRGGK